MLTTVGPFPYPVCVNMIEIAIASNDIHPIAGAVMRGDLGGQAMRNLTASMTPPVVALMKARWDVSIVRNWSASSQALALAGAPQALSPHVLVENFQRHVLSCGVCYRFLRRFDILPAHGYRYNGHGFVYTALNFGEFPLVRWMIHDMGIGMLEPVYSVDVPTNWPQQPFILDVLEQRGLRQGTTEYIELLGHLPITQLPFNGNLCFLAKSYTLQSMANSITVRLIKILHRLNINIGLGCSDEQTAWSTLILSQNPERVQLFHLMARQVPLPRPMPLPLETQLQVNTVCLTQFGYPGWWPPWAMAIMAGDRPAAKFFSQCDAVNPLEPSSMAVLGGSRPAGPLGFGPVIFSPDQHRLIGFAATLSITETNEEFLTQWLSRLPGALLVTEANGLLDIVEHTIARAATERAAILEEPRPPIETPSSWRSAGAQYRQDVISISQRMVQAVLDQRIGGFRPVSLSGTLVDTTVPSDSVAWIPTTVQDLPHYPAWVQSIKNRGYADVISLTNSLDSQIKLTRSGLQ